MATSDEFDGDLSLWTEVDPDAVGAFATDAGNLELVHDSGVDTDLWTDRKNAPRLVQAVTTPLDISTKLVAVPGEDGGVGLAVFNAARTNLVRLDYFTNGGTTTLFFAHVNGSANEVGFQNTVAGNPLWLRIVMPDGDSAEAYTSPDGETWTLRDTLDLTIDGAVTAAEAGPYGSGAFSPFPGSTYLWEHVRFDLAPGGTGPAGGTAAAGLGLALAAQGERQSAGASAFAAGLSLAAAGARESAGAAGFGLGLQLAATGARPSQGSAAFQLGLDLAATTNGISVEDPVDLTVTIGPTRSRAATAVGATRGWAQVAVATEVRTGWTVGDTRTGWAVGPTRDNRGA